jgi:hypothetical protein
MNNKANPNKMNQMNQTTQPNKSNNNISMTTCTRPGIKIRKSDNDYKADPFAGLNPFTNKSDLDSNSVKKIEYDKTAYNAIDLNIDNYSREDLYKLFGFPQSIILKEEHLKEAKKIVLKTHPDKSKLGDEYFIFFSKAFKRICAIYEFQNKTIKHSNNNNNDNYDSNSNKECGQDNSVILDKMFDMNTKLKDPKNFNSWFNDQFEKHRLEEPTENGYGDWLKSEEDIVFSANVTQANMASEIEKRKKQVQALTEYKGVSEQHASTFGGSSLMEYNNNFTSNTLFSNDGMGYTDLRQAYVESVIPVTQDDYDNKQKFRTIDEYKRHRDTCDIQPLSKEEAMRQLYHNNKQKDQESAALAFYYAQQTEKAKRNDDNFWSSIKQVTNW